MTATLQHDSVVFSLAYQTWANAVGQGMSWSADRMMEQLLADPAIRQVVVADPLRSHMSRLRRAHRTSADGFPADERRHLIHPYRARRRDAPDIGASARAYGRLDNWLARRASKLGAAGSVLVTTHPVLAAVANPDAWADIVFYGWDDWAAYPPFAHFEELIRWSYGRMAAHGVSVIGVTEAIVERIGSPRGVVVPNGISAAEFDDVAPGPGWFSQICGPVAFYAGSLEERIDVAALIDLADSLPDWTVVLIGFPNALSHFDELRQRPNVVLRGPEPRRTVLHMMGEADVCLIPHRETPMTVAMSPLKLYEYLGAGAQVVATDLPPMRGVSDRCRLVPPGESLVTAVLEAASAPKADAAEVRRFRSANDWAERYRLWRSVALGG